MRSSNVESKELRLMVLDPLKLCTWRLKYDSKSTINSAQMNEMESSLPTRAISQLDIERTRLAAERTMMALLTTGLSFISFGFTIYTFLLYVREAEEAKPRIQANGPKSMGLALISVGVFVLAAGSWQHWQFVRQLQKQSARKLPWSVTLAAALVLGAIGVIAILTVLIRVWPFRE
jgi:putative membrane protein